MAVAKTRVLQHWCVFRRGGGGGHLDVGPGVVGGVVPRHRLRLLQVPRGPEVLPVQAGSYLKRSLNDENSRERLLLDEYIGDKS